jgi:Protein of unknown function (DUF2934)
MAAERDTSGVDRELGAALGKARRRAPEQDPSVAAFGRDVDELDGQSAGTTAEDATAQDWMVADAARPDFDDETADGLGVIEEEVRHAAEDLPADESFEERVRRKAHELWESEGGPHGRAEDHWRIASELVAEEIAQSRADLPYLGDDDESADATAVQGNLGEFPGLTDQDESQAYQQVTPDRAR